LLSPRLLYAPGGNHQLRLPPPLLNRNRQRQTHKCCLILFAGSARSQDNRKEMGQEAILTGRVSQDLSCGGAMLDEDGLRALLIRAIGGDQEACAGLVHQLEPVIRRAARVHLPLDDPLRRLFDSLDISQSVLVNFFAKAKMDAIRFQSPKELRALLRQMATQKFIDKKRRAEAERRDCRREQEEWAVFAVPDTKVDPYEITSDRELFQEICCLFTRHELEIADLWAVGYSYPEIVERLEGAEGKRYKPNALRMAFERAITRIAGHVSRREC
jgi:DNA-directed RNA polymerase specialized sigma24 family protein